ncbi:DUF4249 domain-containing protein [Lentimicrobium sp.]|jgi:hypothetical protein|uniref:DUF4249 domain-containing protein n=1 Tax=Lentimicrobium sp. TaxID=2034841 RepID=UPI002C75551B|nr:DUF4249 domain-containing protein [Lentimicrobium sp.]HPF64966.1 DUF4249 domain-containing protein [Lentimicrobium sp.]HPJ63105.1 DUF4249 domain-containing protein [Lentimicrobium sp.]HPR26976.1 DUF4249 domain-containing protein [Lentimicrobium sp.]
MKINIIRLILITVASLHITACEDMISEVDVPESDPKIVVFSVISPQDEFITVKVYKSRALYSLTPQHSWEESFPVIPDATVRISNGVDWLQLPYNAETRSYRIASESMPVQASQTYYLDIKAPGGYSAEASCTVPAGTPPDIEITATEYVENFGEQSAMVSFRFKDIPGNGHFYRVIPGTYFSDEYYGDDFFSESGLSRGESVFSDKNREGAFFNFRTSEIYKGNNPDNRLLIWSSVTDEDYYNYHHSVMSFQGDNPFSEPSPVFTNIDGGLGIFAAVNGRLQEFTLNQDQP